MQIQGIVLQKTPYQDRNAIVKLLLRNGQKGSALFYGAHGLGRQRKSSQVELGSLLNVVLRPPKTTSDLALAKEWTPAWNHQNIRYHYPAYACLCLFLELSERVALEAHWPELNLADNTSQGPFRALSNALFQMEGQLKDKVPFSSSQHVLIFVGKLLAELGLYPQVQDCVLCGHIFSPGDFSLPLPDKGGMACISCLSSKSERARAQAGLGPFLKVLWNTKYGELFPLLEKALPPQEVKSSCHSLMHYLHYQCQWGPQALKSWDANCL